MKIRNSCFTQFFFLHVYIICSFSITNVTLAFGEKKSSIDDTSFLEVISEVPEYLIGAEDILEVSVWKNEDLSKVVVVRPDGKISLPLIGDVNANGLTASQLSSNISEKLKKYQDTSIVSVSVQEINSYKIYVLGEVMIPGMYVLKRNTSILQAIALSGGFNQFASRKKVVIIRESVMNIKKEKILVSFEDIVDPDEKNDDNILLKSGDTIFVP